MNLAQKPLYIYLQFFKSRDRDSTEDFSELSYEMQSLNFKSHIDPVRDTIDSQENPPSEVAGFVDQTKDLVDEVRIEVRDNEKKVLYYGLMQKHHECSGKYIDHSAEHHKKMPRKFEQVAQLHISARRRVTPSQGNHGRSRDLKQKHEHVFIQHKGGERRKGTALNMVS